MKRGGDSVTAATVPRIERRGEEGKEVDSNLHEVGVVEVVICMGNPQVSFSIPIPVPVTMTAYTLSSFGSAVFKYILSWSSMIIT